MINLTLRKKIENELKREVIILRQVIYKEIQEWKRKTKIPINSSGIFEAMVLTEADKKFIDQEIQYFLFSDIPEILIKQKAEKILEDLKSVEKPTIPQKDFKQQLEDALTIKSSKKDEEIEVDSIPF